MTNKWVMKMWYIHTIDAMYAAAQNDEFVQFAEFGATWKIS